jgi:antitoxin CptB
MRARRGMLELDFIFERFINHHYDQLSENDKQLFMRLLNEEDPVLYDWLVSDLPCSNAMLQPMVDQIKKNYFHPGN